MAEPRTDLPFYYIPPTMRLAYGILAAGTAASFYVRPRGRLFVLGTSLIAFQGIAIARQSQIEAEREDARRALRVGG